MGSTCDEIIEDETKGMIGLWPSQYKVLKILNDAPVALSERQVRQRYPRRSPLHAELRILVALGLVSREKKGRIYFYNPKKRGVHYNG